MSESKVTSVSVSELLDKCRSGEWLVPQFQREFVWSIANVEDLIASTLAARPIGMATIWEQSDDSGLDLDHLSLPDTPTADNPHEDAFFGDPEAKTNRNFAILDGRQRSTALAMAFGGFSQNHGNRKFSGKFYLDVTDDHVVRPVKFFRKKQVAKLALDNDTVALSRGLVPLAIGSSASLDARWFQLGRDLDRVEVDHEGNEILRETVDRWVERFDRAHEALRTTRLAVYIVPSRYDLGEICEIFETLNTTGTRVSTVDLVHSWLYADSHDTEGGSLLLRDWIRELGQQSGAEGWAEDTNRPELTAQIITACYVASDERPDPRPVGGKTRQIGSIRAADLLATPTLHWRKAMENSGHLAAWLRDLQHVVANGRFGHQDCPYPASCAIYSALRWHKHFDHKSSTPWSTADLNQLFKAFFWRNVLTTRYDQGFLTQVGTDIKFFKSHLATRSEYESSDAWSLATIDKLDELMDSPLPDVDFTSRRIQDGSVRGALRQAFQLPMKAGVQRDLVRPHVDIQYPDGVDADMHHVFPKAWLRKNATGRLADELNRDEIDLANGAANLIPLSAESNRTWRDKSPGVALLDTDLSDEARKDAMQAACLDGPVLDKLREVIKSSDTDKKILEFWELRSRQMAERLLSRATFSAS